MIQTTEMNDYQVAAKWAHDLSQRDNWCVLDTETTGLGSTAEICQLGVLAANGEELLNTLVKPSVEIEPGACRVHGITQETVAMAPTFEQVFIPLLKAVGNRDVIIYNAEFDLRLLRQSAKACGFQLAFPTSDRRQCRIFLNGGSIYCVMQWYSQWVGDWNDYHGNYRWQKLPSGDHTAIGDCKAVIEVIERIANSHAVEAKHSEIAVVPPTFEPSNVVEQSQQQT